MGARGLIAVILLAACGGGGGSARPAKPAADQPVTPAPPDPSITETGRRVVAEFEKAVLESEAAFAAMFDFAAVGEFEILLHRYDLNGRLSNLSEKVKEQFRFEDGTPYPAERERRNVTRFYKRFVQRTVGTGACTARVPRTKYGKLLGQPYEPLPAGTPPDYETLRTHVNEWVGNGGAVALTCTGGRGSLVVVYTARDNPRGYDIVTIYDD
ncbi:MAG: hypothetical protein KF773_28560 [Deltaproteobacteria bacterium]|nr:hypothetical protein [Deltaproteobacteria bacterium]